MGYGNDSVDVARLLNGFQFDPERRRQVIARYGFANCQFKYFEYWSQMADGKMSQEDWQTWYHNHCGQCPCMSEICMAEVINEDGHDYPND